MGALVFRVLKTCALIFFAAVLWSIITIALQIIMTAKLAFEWPSFTALNIHFDLMRVPLAAIEEVARAIVSRIISSKFDKFRIIGFSLVGGLMEASFVPRGQEFLSVGNLMPVLAHCLYAFTLCVTWKKYGIIPAILAATALHFAYNTLAGNL